MARLNLASPVKGDTTQKKPRNYRKIGLKTPLQRRFRDASPGSPSEDKEDRWTAADDTRSTSRAPRTADMLSQVKSRSKRLGTTTARKKQPAGGIFDIFSDSDGASEREEPRPTTARKYGGAKSSRPSDEKAALKLAPVNSMLLAPLQQQQSRGRQPRKSETYDYNKENDPVEHQQDDDEYHSSISRNPSDASSRRSPVRRTARSGDGEEANDSRRSLFLNYRQPAIHLDDGESEDNSFNSMDDFVVSDSEEPSFRETSDDDQAEDEDITIKKLPTPKPKKRLIKGRRPSPEEELKRALQNSPQKGNFLLEPSLPAEIVRLSPEKSRRFFQDRNKVAEKMNDLSLDVESDDDDPSSQLQQDLFEATTRFEPPSDEAEPEQATLETPPSSPSSNRLCSSTPKIRIPPALCLESSDASWSQETPIDWIDQHSPQKLDKFLEDFAEDSEDDKTEKDLMPRRRVTKKEPKGPSKTALKKAEVEQRKAALARRKSFDGKKAALAEDFFKVLDDAVTGGKVQQLAEETGGVQISWSKTLQTTAGRASWKREKQAQPDQASRLSRHHATIELAERIIDSEDRLLNTLAHEYCHLANFMISNIHNNPHGASFKNWGYKCKEALKNHPVYGGRVEVTTKHSYKIDYKYVWCCVDCGQNYGRHSKSIDTARARCGKCQGLLQQIKPKPRNVSPRKKQSPQSQPVVDDVVEVLGAVSLQG
ncbi:SprT-like family-domain-containing protein [Aspergillus ambiguus]|uniref:SprT family zinc-dependent metalloprotease n=1 Tax=Aspergillus ambiguus TaxID=176160 RepID=UPI003CCDA359